MCIRDSLHGGGGDEDLELLLEFFEHALRVGDDVEAVSYTHLDVYKRQAQ